MRQVSEMGVRTQLLWPIVEDSLSVKQITGYFPGNKT